MAVAVVMLAPLVEALVILHQHHPLRAIVVVVVTMLGLVVEEVVLLNPVIRLVKMVAMEHLMILLAPQSLMLAAEAGGRILAH